MNILIADDHRLLLETLRDFIQSNMADAQVKTVTRYADFIQCLDDDDSYELALMDYRMPDVNGIDTVKMLLKKYQSTPLAIMSGLATRSEIIECVNVGVIGFVPKTLSGQAMVSAIHLMLSGERYIPSVALSTTPEPDDLEASPGSVSLSTREREVLQKLHLGYSNKEIARALELEEVTIKMYVSRLSKKFGVKNRTQLVVEALSRGYLT